MKLLSWCAVLSAAALCLSLAGPAQAADPRNLAPGFSVLPADAKLAVFPVDVELLSMSAGGVLEGRADWTADARKHMMEAVASKVAQSKLSLLNVSDDTADEFAEQVGLHAAVANSVALHHGVGGVWALPSKNGQLLWSFGDAMQPVAAKAGASHGLFLFVRDSYASAERKVAMVALALLGVGLTGGAQIGYASLVDLQTGQVLWFNRLARGSGDLREAASAEESMAALLDGLPLPQ